MQSKVQVHQYRRAYLDGRNNITRNKITSAHGVNQCGQLQCEISLQVTCLCRTLVVLGESWTCYQGDGG